MTFKIYFRRGLFKGDWRWRLMGANGEIVGTGEGYYSRANAERAVKSIMLGAANATIEVVER